MLEAPATALSDAEQVLEAGQSPKLRCVVCARAITTLDEATRVAGAHRHEFANPAGQRFRIGCYANAPGAAASGAPSDYWSWFDGCHWRIAECRGCAVQLGWQFCNSSGQRFFAPIVDALVESAS